MVKTIEPEKKQSENQMPAIRWVKIWPKISGVFSLLALIVIILNSAVFSEYLTIPVWVSGDNGKSMSLVFSLISFAALIYHIDIPGRLGNQLQKINRLKEVGSPNLHTARIWVVINYTSANIFGNLIIELMDGFDWVLFLVVIVCFGVLLVSINKFRDIVRGTKDLDLISSVHGANSLGFIFSLILGIGGEFYLSAWIFIVNLVAKLKTKSNTLQGAQKIEDDHYWNQLITLELKDPAMKVLSNLYLFDLFMFFLLFKDFIDLMLVFVDSPDQFALPALFLITILMAYFLPRITSRYSNKGIKIIYSLYVALKFVICGFIYSLLPFEIETSRLGSLLTGAISINLGLLIFGISLFSPFLNLIIPLTNIAENAKNKRNLPLFNRLFWTLQASVLSFVGVIIGIVALSIPSAQLYTAIIGIGFIFPLFIFADVVNYNHYQSEILSKEPTERYIAARKILLYAFLSFAISILLLLLLRFYSFLGIYLKGAIFSVPILLNVVGFTLVGLKVFSHRREVFLLGLTTLFFSTAFWAFILYTIQADQTIYYLTFVVAYLIGLALVYGLSMCKRPTASPQEIPTPIKKTS